MPLLNRERSPPHPYYKTPFLRPQEVMVLEVLRKDASLQIDEILDLLETQLTSYEVFTALFELEMADRIRGLPGKIYVKTM
jgi:DNA processing protein